jgi:hypothetical protein
MSGILENNGNIIGFIMSTIYTSISGFLFYNLMIIKCSGTDEKMKICNENKVSAYITIFVLMLIVSITLIYYLMNKKNENKKSVNKNVAAISFTPFIIAFIRYAGPFAFLLLKK